MQLEEQKKPELYVVKDPAGNSIVIVNDIILKGKRRIDWQDVESYVRKYIGEFYEIGDTKDIVYIDKDFPDEFAGSKDTHNLRGTSAKAKANTAQCIPQMIEIASNKKYKENFNDKHRLDAKYGWYRYDTRVGIPLFSDIGEIERYNVFLMELLIRHSHDGKLYLYDVVNIKKETSNPLEQ